MRQNPNQNRSYLMKEIALPVFYVVDTISETLDKEKILSKGRNPTNFFLSNFIFSPCWMSWKKELS